MARPLGTALREHCYSVGVAARSSATAMSLVFVKLVGQRDTIERSLLIDRIEAYSSIGSVAGQPSRSLGRACGLIAPQSDPEQLADRH